jgi:hypothetical protein
MGYEADDLLCVFDTLKEEDIWQYRYPDDQELNKIGVRGIYLGNYVRWDPKAQHEQMMHEYGYRTSTFPRTFDCYDYVDCFNYMGLHDMLKLYKHGFSKVTDHASREIRFGRLNREQGIKLVKQHELIPYNYQQQFCEWLGVTPRSLNFIIDQHRNPNFWTQTEFGKWEFNGWSTRHDQTCLQGSTFKEMPAIFEANDSMESGRDSEYITIGKGWP